MENLNLFIYELGMLKRVKRAGQWLAGVEYSTESVADHSFRASVIAFILAKLEGANPEKAALICLIHDIPESRILDRTKVAAKYVDFKEADKKAFEEQLQRLPKNVAIDFKNYYEEYEIRNTKEGIIAKDADLLECAYSAKEYIDSGHKAMQGWLDRIKTALQTESAKKLMRLLEKTDSCEWWEELKKNVPVA